ncbi:unnamed protein product [Dibothriocephalus latus]|uniref:Uncharacterized protein n=1 Tax=Dibothriocephalus latus TaxID=60516 RepID=A0A3P7L8K7_DIBLA|nr:unnamed protein product [Dibothriocephalus latus]
MLLPFLFLFFFFFLLIYLVLLRFLHTTLLLFFHVLRLFQIVFLLFPNLLLLVAVLETGGGSGDGVVAKRTAAAISRTVDATDITVTSVLIHAGDDTYVVLTPVSTSASISDAAGLNTGNYRTTGCDSE